jgi:uroporphyrinogen decarboxylase
MTHRERILAALDHRTPDRVPVDLGSSYATSIHAHAYAEVRRHLGLPSEPEPRYLLPRAVSIIPADDIMERFQIDTRPLVIGAPDRQRGGFTADDVFVDEWQVTWTKPEGGHFLNTNGPFRHLIDPTPRDLDEFSWPDPEDPGRYRGLRERAQTLAQATDHAIVLDLWVGLVHIAQFMRGFAEWLEDLVLNPTFAEALMERIEDFWVRGAERALAEVGPYVDVVQFVEDLATQRGPMMRPDLYRRMIKPHHRRMAEVVKRQGKRLLFHCCGSARAFLPDFIDIGVDAITPVQVSAAHMDTRCLKREFGRDLAFWGGIDTAEVLPRGTPADVRAEVRRRIDDLAASGGFVLCAVHNIQADVPPENIAAMYDEAIEYGRMV